MSPPRSRGFLASTVLLAAVLGGCSQADSFDGSGPDEDVSMTTTQPVGSASDAAKTDASDAKADGLEQTAPDPEAVEATDAAPASDDTAAEPTGSQAQAQPSAEASAPLAAGEGDDASTSAAADRDEAEDDTSAPIAAANQFVYPDEPEPAESVVATLCNLNQDHLTALRNEDAAGRPVVDDDMRMSVLALNDQLSYWDTLRSSYPEATADIDRASQVYDLWDGAVLSQENGDASAAQSAMVEADEVISTLSNEAVAGEVCVG